MAKRPSMGTARLGPRGFSVNRAYAGPLPENEGMLRGLVRHAEQLAEDLRSIAAQIEASAAAVGIPIGTKIDDPGDADVGCTPSAMYVGLVVQWQMTAESGAHDEEDEEAARAAKYEVMKIAAAVLHAAGYKITR